MKAYLKNLVRLYPVLRRLYPVRKPMSDPEDTSRRQLAYDNYIPDDQNITVKSGEKLFVSTLNINSDTYQNGLRRCWIIQRQEKTSDQITKSDNQKL